MMMLDTQTLDGSYRLTAICDSGEEILKEMFRWLRSSEIISEDIWYADIFRLDPEGEDVPERIGCLEVAADNMLEIVSMPDGRSPFKRRFRPLRGWIKRLKNRL